MATYYVDWTAGNNSNAGTSEGAAWKTLDFAIGSTGTSGVTAGDVIFVKDNGSYAEAVQIPNTRSGTAASGSTVASLIRVKGYSSTPNDSGRATITGSGLRTNCILFDHTAAAYYQLENLVITGSTSSGVAASNADNIVFRNCVFDDIGGRAVQADNSITFYDCTFTEINTGSTANAAAIQADIDLYVGNCVFDDVYSFAISMDEGCVEGCRFRDCGQQSNTTPVILIETTATGRSYILHNTFYGNYASNFHPIACSFGTISSPTATSTPMVFRGNLIYKMNSEPVRGPGMGPQVNISDGNVFIDIFADDNYDSSWENYGGDSTETAAIDPKLNLTSGDDFLRPYNNSFVKGKGAGGHDAGALGRFPSGGPREA